MAKNGNKGTICTRIINFSKDGTLVKWRPGGCVEQVHNLIGGTGFLARSANAILINYLCMTFFLLTFGADRSAMCKLPARVVPAWGGLVG